MWNKNSYSEPATEEVGGNEFVNFSIETPSSSDTENTKVRKFGKRVVLGIAGLIAILVIVIPITVVIILQKHGWYLIEMRADI